MTDFGSSERMTLLTPSAQTRLASRKEAFRYAPCECAETSVRETKLILSRD